MIKVTEQQERVLELLRSGCGVKRNSGDNAPTAFNCSQVPG